MNPNYTTIHFKYKLWVAGTMGYGGKEAGVCILALMFTVPYERSFPVSRLALTVGSTTTYLKRSELLLKYFDFDDEKNLLIPNNEAYFLFTPEKRTPISKYTRQIVWDNAHGLCTYCDEELTIDIGDSQFHVDHIIPFSKGGSDDINNLTASCRKCNLQKGSL